MILNMYVKNKDELQQPDINPVKEPYENEPLPDKPKKPPEKSPGKETPNTIKV